MSLSSPPTWERRFGSDASLIGRTVRLNRENYTVSAFAANFSLLGFTLSSGRLSS